MDGFRFERDAGGQLNGKRQIGLRLDLKDRCRGDWSKIMGVEHPQQSVGQLGEFVVQPVVNPRGEKGGTLEQSRDVRIIHCIRCKAQPAGDLGVCAGKIRRKTANRVELAVIIGQQTVRHRRSSEQTRRCPA